MPFIKFLLNILKLNSLTYDWFRADGSLIISAGDAASILLLWMNVLNIL